MSGDGLTEGNATARSSFFGFSEKENEMWGGMTEKSKMNRNESSRERREYWKKYWDNF